MALGHGSKWPARPGCDCQVKGGARNGGGAEGIRTPGLLIANEALSQLSYSPVPQGADNAQSPRRSQARLGVRAVADRIPAR